MLLDDNDEFFLINSYFYVKNDALDNYFLFKLFRI